MTPKDECKKEITKVEQSYKLPSQLLEEAFSSPSKDDNEKKFLDIQLQIAVVYLLMLGLLFLVIRK